MPERLSESPFQEIGEGKRWEYTEKPELGDPLDRPFRITVLGVLMLAIAAELILPTVMVVGMLCFFFLFGFYNPIFRDTALLTVILLPFVLAPMTLQIIMGIGLFRLARWSRVGSMVALIASLTIGTALRWSTEWLRRVDPTSRRLVPHALSDWQLHLLLLAPLVAVMLFTLLRKETIAEFTTEHGG